MHTTWSPCYDISGSSPPCDEGVSSPFSSSASRHWASSHKPHRQGLVSVDATRLPGPTAEQPDQLANCYRGCLDACKVQNNCHEYIVGWSGTQIALGCVPLHLNRHFWVVRPLKHSRTKSNRYPAKQAAEIALGSRKKDKERQRKIKKTKTRRKEEKKTKKERQRKKDKETKELVASVRDWVRSNPDALDAVVFDVFTPQDHNIYSICTPKVFSPLAEEKLTETEDRPSSDASITTTGTS